jgi:hypothetical protein
MDAKEFIEHVGVKGMKWGVRKRPDPNRSASKWKERKDKERAEKEKASKKKAGSGKDKTDPVFSENFGGPTKTVRGELTVEKGGKPPKRGDKIKDKGPDGKDREHIIKEIDRVGGSDSRYRIKATRPMTDVELRNEISRMQVEKQYKELVAATTPPPQLTRGQKFAKEAGKVGVNVLTKAVTEVGTQVVKTELQKALGVSGSGGGKKSSPVETPKAAPKVVTWKPPKPRTTPAGTPKTLGTVWKP